MTTDNEELGTMGTRRTAATEDRTVATAEDGKVTLQLAHHWTDTDGIAGEPGKSYTPGTEDATLQVTPDLARQLAGAGLVLGVDPFDSASVQKLVTGDAGPAAPVEGQGEEQS